jgi:hypothetical protein
MGNITETIVFEKLEADMEDIMMDVSVNPDFKDFDWDIPINKQSWYTPSTDIDLDRDVPDIIWEPEYLGDR